MGSMGMIGHYTSSDIVSHEAKMSYIEAVAFWKERLVEYHDRNKATSTSYLEYGARRL